MGITDIHYPLSLFSENFDKAIRAYREFMDEEEKSINSLKLEEIRDSTNESVPINLERRQIKKTLPELIAMTATEYGIDPLELYGKSKNRNASAARKALILLSMEHTVITRREIAIELGVTETAITKMIARGVEDQRDRKERMAKCHCQA
jgi:chromosomal replication initiation ATPase DnaA